MFSHTQGKAVPLASFVDNRNLASFFIVNIVAFELMQCQRYSSKYIVVMFHNNWFLCPERVYGGRLPFAASDNRIPRAGQIIT